MYTIKVDYQTGDSFHTEDTSDTLNGEWTLEVAKENLKRIKEHYSIIKDRKNYYSIAMQKKAEKELEEAKTKPWYSGKYWEYGIMLLENDGSSKQHHCNWTGYFESLYGASIIACNKDDDDMSFTL